MRRCAPWQPTGALSILCAWRLLASLNIADELESLREQYAMLAGSMTQSRSRSASLSSKLDEVFSELDAPVRRAG